MRSTALPCVSRRADPRQPVREAEGSSSHPALSRYAFGIAATAVALLLAALFWPTSGHLPSPWFFAAVILSAWHGGAGPGLVAAALSAVCSGAFFPPEAGRMGSAAGMGLLFLVAVLFGSMTAARRRAGEMLSGQSRQLRVMLASIREAVIVSDREGRVTLMNLAAESLTGWSRGEAKGRLIAEIFDIRETSGGFAENRLRETIRLGAATGHDERIVLRSKDGSEMPVTHSATPILDDEGSVRGVLLVFRDVKNLEEAEQKLRRSEQALADVLDNAAIGMQWVGPDGRILSASRAELDMLGYTSDEYVGRNIADFHVDREVVEELLRRLRSGETFSGVEARVRCKDGSIRRVLIDSNALWRDRDCGISRCITRDVTERNGNEIELQRLRAKENVEAASQAKDRFLGILGHELRTPLTPVLVAVTELESVPRLSPAARKDLAVIRRNIELEARLIDDLLDLTMIGKGKLELGVRPVDVHALVENVWEICGRDIEAKRLESTLELKAARRTVLGDPTRIQQVLWNLVRNAVKFTPDGGRIAIRSANRNGLLRIEVSDSGIGIEKQHLSRIFEAFEQADRSITQRYGGLGVGLSIARALIEAQGGRLSAESGGAGEGCTFTVELPVSAGAQEATAAARAPEREDKRRGPMRILLVEDHEDTAQMMSHLIGSRGYEVRAASTMEAALEARSSERFDVLVSDIGLPDGSGLDLMKRLRDAGPIKGIALSGYGMAADVRRSLEAGFDVHLTKPVDLARLLSEIAKMAGSIPAKRQQTPPPRRNPPSSRTTGKAGKARERHRRAPSR